MTPLKEITGISLEKAKSLKEAGYPQEKTGFCHLIDKEPEDDEPMDDSLAWWGCESDYWHEEDYEWFAAPTAEEILQKLPKEITIDRTKYVLQIFWYTHEGGRPCVRYVSDMDTDFFGEYPEYGVTGDTLNEALSDMYIHLSQHNLL